MRLCVYRVIPELSELISEGQEMLAPYIENIKILSKSNIWLEGSRWKNLKNRN